MQLGKYWYLLFFLNEDNGPQKNLNELGSDHERMDR